MKKTSEKVRQGYDYSVSKTPFFLHRGGSLFTGKSILFNGVKYEGRYKEQG